MNSTSMGTARVLGLAAAIIVELGGIVLLGRVIS